MNDLVCVLEPSFKLVTISTLYGVRLATINFFIFKVHFRCVHITCGMANKVHFSTKFKSTQCLIELLLF